MKDQILSLTGNIMLVPGIIFSICMITLMILLIFVLEQRKKIILKQKLIHEEQKFFREQGHIRKDPSVSIRSVWKLLIPEVVCFVILFMFISFLWSAGSLAIEGKKHGMFQNNLTVSEVQYDIHHSPVESKLPEQKKNILVLYYKFGCPDCNAVYQNEQMILGNTPVYWVSSRSKQGKALLEKYPVGEVPSGVYINNEGKGEVLVIYNKDENGKSVLNTANLNTLINRYKSANPDQ